MFLFLFLVSIWSNKIIDYNIVVNTNYNRIDDRDKNEDNFDSIILCKDISLKAFKNLKNKNIIYTYEENTPSKHTHNFLLTLLASRYNILILTSKHNYFKKFQYNFNDVSLIKIEEIKNNKTNDYFIFSKEYIQKNTINFLIENEHNHLFIRI